MNGPESDRSQTPPRRVLAPGTHYLRDGDRSVVPVGVHLVPASGPDWPWRSDPGVFDRAFAQMAAMGLDCVRVDIIWSAVEPQPGHYDEAHLERLDAILEAARRRGLRLHPVLFIGGEVGDAVWDVPWREGRHPHADAEMRRLQADHAAMLARRWADDPAVLAWDLTDEPPSWLHKDTDDESARLWTAEIAAAIRGCRRKAADHDRHRFTGSRSRSVPRRRGGAAARLRLRPSLPDLLPRALPRRAALGAHDPRRRLRDGARGGSGQACDVARVRGLVRTVRAGVDRRLRPPAELVEPGARRHRLLPLVLDRRRAGRLRPRALRPHAARDPVRAHRPRRHAATASRRPGRPGGDAAPPRSRCVRR